MLICDLIYVSIYLSFVNINIYSTGELKIRRLITATHNTPTWAQTLGFPRVCYVLDEAVINPYTKSMQYSSINISYASLLILKEKCLYKLMNNEENKTFYTQTINVTSNQWFGYYINNLIENYSMNMLLKVSEKRIKSTNFLTERWNKLGFDGFQRILQYRKQCCQMMNQLKNIKQMYVQ